MMCLVFTLAVLLLTLSGLCLMVGWKNGASKLARIAFVLVIGSAIVSWFIDALRVWFRQTSVQIVVGGLVVLVLVALALLGIGWFLKNRSEEKSASRPTLRRRAPLFETASKDQPPSLPAHPSSSSTDDLNLFGGSR